MTQLEYHLTFPKQYTTFTSPTVTFKINNIKSRLPSVLYFIFRGYDIHDNLIFTYNSHRWVIDTEYRKRSATFEIDTDTLDEIAYSQIELVAIGISSENPLYFNQVMFNEGEEIDYSTPNMRVSKTIGFKNTRYCNLYGTDGSYLQVIRPEGDAISTDSLIKSKCTVIAPHLDDESDIDDPINIFMEFINQTEQRIDVLR